MNFRMSLAAVETTEAGDGLNAGFYTDVTPAVFGLCASAMNQFRENLSLTGLSLRRHGRQGLDVSLCVFQTAPACVLWPIW